MITRNSFVKLADEMRNFYVETLPKMIAIGFADSEDNPILMSMDKMLDILADELDPHHIARDDEIVWDCGSYLIDWLYGDSAIAEKCPLAGDLYDYVEYRYRNYRETNCAH